MKPSEWILLLTASLFAGGGAAFATQWLGGRSSAAAPRGAARDAAGPDLAHLDDTIEALREHQAELERALEQLLATAPGAPTRRPEGQLERAVATWLETHAGELLATGPDGLPLVASPVDRRLEAMNAVAALQRAEWGEGGEAAFWQSLRAEGRLDDVIQLLEENAEGSPYDADLQVDLASAYGQKVYDLGPGALQTRFRQKQDDAFDQALEVEPNHWEARFSKAMALAEWPTFLGKTGEAIHQLELLADQQEGRPSEGRNMGTYFVLGNLYRESGRAAEAAQIWRRGLQQFPGARQLQDQLALLASEEQDQ